MTEASQTNPPQPLIYNYQQAAFDRICAIARAFIHTNFERLPIKPRGNLFLVAPSGSGKTHLAHAVAKSMNLEFLPISVSEWIVMGANQRSAPSTWPLVWQFLHQAEKKEGCIIFLDELDKIGRATHGEWTRSQTTEIFTLLDRRLPKNMNDPDSETLSETQLGIAESVLRTKTLILAGGAFQGIWDTPDPIGFGSSPESSRVPDLNRLSEYIPTELSRRFGSQLITLPRLQECDYLEMLGQILPSLPAHWQDRYESLALAGIPEATRLAQGPRYFEELLLEVVVQERLEISSPLQPQTSSVSPAHGNGTDIGA